jgi:predicted Zn-dependent peptidase
MKMKSKISVLIVLFLLSISVNAQLDRSQQPKQGPAPKISIDKPNEFELKNGLKVLVVENHKLPRVSFSLTIDNTPIFEGDKAGIKSILSGMLGNGTTTIPKDEFNEEVDFLGARINFGSQSAFAQTLSKYSDRILELMADAAINPLFTEDEFNKTKEQLSEGLKTNEKNVAAIASRVGSALSYGLNHPSGEITTEATINNISLTDVIAFHEQYFNPTKAYLVVVGDVDFKTIKQQIESHFGAWVTAANVSSTLPKVSPNVQYTQINFIDMPNAVQSDIRVTNNVDLKMTDDNYHAALIANSILGGGREGYVYQNLRAKNGYTYGAYSGIGASRYGASRFSAVAQVRNEVTDSSVVELMKEIKRIKTEPVDPEALKLTKAKYVGDFVMDLESPETIANYALNVKLNDLPEDFYTTYLQKINAVTTDDVMRVANEYFSTDNARIIVVGKGSEVIENLEKTGIPIKYYNTYAKPSEKPVFTKEIPAGMTAQTVIDTYIQAVGGKANLEKVTTVLNNADVTIEGAPFKPKAVMKSMTPNKMSMEMMIEGMGTVMKQKFDGATGYLVQQGQQIPMTEDQITQKQLEKGLFPELYLDPTSLKLDAIVPLNGSDAYKVIVTNGEKVSQRYYDTASGLLIRTESTSEVQGQTMTSTEELSNYKEVDGVMMPFMQKITAGPQVITFNFTDIKINEGVSEADFK